MSLQFTKMHGLGNDYVYLGLFDQQVDDPPELARVISDRHLGVGGDGLILVGPPEVNDAHIRMQVFNADGSRAGMCGNGLRCAAKLAYDRGWTHANPLRVQTDSGVLTLDLTVDQSGRVTLARADIGEPILDPKLIPVALDGQRVVNVPILFMDKKLPVTCVSMGSAHAIFFVDNLTGIPLSEWGPALEHHPLFPNRINVHFVRVLAPDRVEMVIWERGSGATQACGTGACAVCVASVLNDKCGRSIAVEMPGGVLLIEWNEATNHVFMTGPAVEAFTGEWR